MEPIRIDIPNAKPPDPMRKATELLAGALDEAGIDYAKAMRNEMMIAMIREWVSGRWTRQQFLHACQNMTILNPGLRASQKG